MAEISAQDVKKLREMTNAGMMDCKKALAEANGDLKEAEAILRKKGISTAEKKAGRDAKEGVIAAAIESNSKIGVLVEINCETDFVAKNESFKEFTAEIARLLVQDPEADLEPHRVKAVAALGENILISRHTRYELDGSGLIASYIHLAGKVGVLVEVACGDAAIEADEGFRNLVKDITLHIAAAHPAYISRDQVDAAEIAREREIYAAQVAGKPANIIDKIVDGKLDKYLAGICLLEQGFIKDPDTSISNLLAAKAKELGTSIVINRFVRYQVGESSAAS